MLHEQETLYVNVCVFIVWMISLFYKTLPLTLLVRSVRLGVSPSSWTDESLSGTSWRLWCSCCRYERVIMRTALLCQDKHAFIGWGWWCYWCCFRMWFQPRCRWSAWWSQMNSGIRRSHTSASGRRKTAWASRWVCQLLLAKLLQDKQALCSLYAHWAHWEVTETILELDVFVDFENLYLTWKGLVFVSMNFTSNDFHWAQVQSREASLVSLK